MKLPLEWSQGWEEMGTGKVGHSLYTHFLEFLGLRDPEVLNQLLEAKLWWRWLQILGDV